MKIIFFIFVLLFASLYVHSETADSADVDYCLAFRSKQVMLFLVKENNLWVIRTAEEPIECEHDGYATGSYGVDAVIDFIDKSNKSIVMKGAMGVAFGGSGGSTEKTNIKKRYLLDRDMQINYPRSLSFRAFEMPSKEKEDVFKRLLQFKSKIVNGDVTAFPDCKPHKLEYKTKFRARIVGECDCDFLKEREESCE